MLRALILGIVQPDTFHVRSNSLDALLGTIHFLAANNHLPAQVQSASDRKKLHNNKILTKYHPGQTNNYPSLSQSAGRVGQKNQSSEPIHIRYRRAVSHNFRGHCPYL